MNTRLDITQDLNSQARRQLEKAIEELIAFVDLIDGDENLEDDGTAEHSLGWTDRGPNASRPNVLDDLEDGADSEPSLGSIGDYGFTSQQSWSAGALNDCEKDDSDFEPWLGWDTNGQINGDNDTEADVVDECHDAEGADWIQGGQGA